LDEPTSGLDPNQVIAIRALIKDLSKTKTVVLSTHIMQEVDAICENVIIINKGKIVADDTLTGLRTKHNTKSLENIFIELTGSHVHQAQII
jgi:ABC-2 type transport system ATP-binding protein